MIKKIIYDYIHCTQMEFFFEHLFVVLGMTVIIFGAGYIALTIQEKIRNKKKNDQTTNSRLP
jgi:hypothetical protein